MQSGGCGPSVAHLRHRECGRIPEDSRSGTGHRNTYGAGSVCWALPAVDDFEHETNTAAGTNQLHIDMCRQTNRVSMSGLT